MKRLLWILTAGALVSGAFVAAPATAQEPSPAPVVPAEPNIVDPIGDANYLNDQGLGGLGGVVPREGNHTTPADAASVADIQAVWFTADKESVSAHIHTEAAPPATASILFRVQVNPGGGNSTSCLWFQAWLPGAGNVTGERATLRDTCETAVPTSDGELLMAEAEGGGGIVTVKVPRSAHPALAEGALLGAPEAHSRHNLEVVVAPQIDNTETGTDFVAKSGDSGDDGKDKDKDKKKKKKKKKKKADVPKKCKKLKGKAKKKCIKKGDKKKKGPQKCAAFKPGEQGAEAETVVVTDKATEEEPLEQTVTHTQSIADLTFGQTDASYSHFNIQVDSKAKDVGLYVLFEFPQRNDYDLNLLHPDGSYAARSRAFNTVIEANETQVSATGHGGESTASSEKLVGIKTSDCGGWTLETANYLGMGGDFPIKVWLGEVENEPQAPGEETP